MSDYCSQCTPYEKADYNLVKMALELKRGYSFSLLCEGCNNRAIYKDETGRLYLYRAEKDNPDLQPLEVSLDEL